MNKLIIAALMLGTLSGCMETTTSDISNDYIMPRGMEDCQVFKMKSSTERDIFVVRCPTTTSTMETHKEGKTSVTTNVTTPNYL